MTKHLEKKRMKRMKILKRDKNKILRWLGIILFYEIQDYDNIEVTFTEKEVLRKISDLQDKLKIRAASVGKARQFAYIV